MLDINEIEEWLFSYRLEIPVKLTIHLFFILVNLPGISTDQGSWEKALTTISIEQVTACKLVKILENSDYQ